MWGKHLNSFVTTAKRATFCNTKTKEEEDKVSRCGRDKKCYPRVKSKAKFSLRDFNVE